MTMTITRLRAEGMLKELRAMPPVDKGDQQLSKQEAINVLAPEIRAMSKRAYSTGRIASTLTRLGLNISTTTLRNYLQRSKASAKKATKPVANKLAQTGHAEGDVV